MNKLSCIAILALLSFLPATAKDKADIKVIPAAEDFDAINNGIIYSLPQTIIRVRIEAELTIQKAGPFYKYSNRYLNLNNVIIEDSKKWSIKSASIETYGKADMKKRFKVVATNSTLPAIVLSTDNTIVGVNARERVKRECDETVFDKDEELTFDDVRLDKSILTKTSSAAMAEETAVMIYKLREKRMMLLGGDEATILHDEGSYKQVLAQIEKQENDLVSLFAGREKKIKVVKYFDITPESASSNGNVLLRFSEKDGFLDVMDLSGKPVYVDIAFNEPPRINEYGAQSKQRKAAPLYGLRYIIPGSINVKIIDRNILLTEKNILCTQNGQVATLPADMLADKDVSILFDNATGAIKQIKYNNESNKAKWEKK
ncbi:MAG: DUF4831 family protein [Bacteroidales bacterium]|nr:DUF4831 family protein [Bacteroidales bacterium]